MENLTSIAISREVARCVARERYRLCVIFITHDDARLYREKLLSEIKSNQDVWRYFEDAKYDHTPNNTSIRLPNGSSILFMGVPNEAFRGHRFHKILIDNDVWIPNNDPRMTMLRAMETLDYYETERQIRKNATNWIF